VNELGFYDILYSSYEVVYVKPMAQVVRFENSKGWYEEATLTETLAWWILMKQLKVRYE
jgi:hypothetical protein